MSIDDKHSDHDLKAYLDGRDGVSAAYRQTAQEEPPAALDRFILDAARKPVQPPRAVSGWYARPKPYALAASVMLAVVALSLYVGGLDEVAVAPESAVLRQDAPRTVEFQPAETVEFQPAERAAPAQEAADATQAVGDTAPPAAPAPAPRQLATRQLAPPLPAVSNAGAAPPAAAPVANANDAFVRLAEPPTVVIDGPLLERLESEAEAARAQAGAQTGELQEITVTGSRIVRREAADVSYRQSREDWLAAMRTMVLELERSARLTAAQRSTAVLQSELEEEIDLFLAEYPDTDIEAELDTELDLDE